MNSTIDFISRIIDNSGGTNFEPDFSQINQIRPLHHNFFKQQQCPRPQFALPDPSSPMGNYYFFTAAAIEHLKKIGYAQKSAELKKMHSYLISGVFNKNQDWSTMPFSPQYSALGKTGLKSNPTFELISCFLNLNEPEEDSLFQAIQTQNKLLYPALSPEQVHQKTQAVIKKAAIANQEHNPFENLTNVAITNNKDIDQLSKSLFKSTDGQIFKKDAYGEFFLSHLDPQAQQMYTLLLAQNLLQILKNPTDTHTFSQLADPSAVLAHIPTIFNYHNPFLQHTFSRQTGSYTAIVLDQLIQTLDQCQEQLNQSANILKKANPTLYKQLKNCPLTLTLDAYSIFSQHTLYELSANFSEKLLNFQPGITQETIRLLPKMAEIYLDQLIEKLSPYVDLNQPFDQIVQTLNNYQLPHTGGSLTSILEQSFGPNIIESMINYHQQKKADLALNQDSLLKLTIDHIQHTNWHLFENVKNYFQDTLKAKHQSELQAVRSQEQKQKIQSTQQLTELLFTQLFNNEDYLLSPRQCLLALSQPLEPKSAPNTRYKMQL